MSTATKVITVMPGDPLIVEKPPEPDPFAGRSMQLWPADKMRPVELSRLASQLTSLSGGELLVVHDPEMSPTGFEYQLADETTMMLTCERYAEAAEEDGNVAAAVIRELEFIAEEHRKLVERMREAFKDYIPNGWK